MKKTETKANFATASVVITQQTKKHTMIKLKKKMK